MQPDAFNLRHLRAFCAVASSGSISAAAPAVHLSQPAITQAIAKLERALGIALFVRTSSGMIATDAGQAMAYRCSRALDFIQAGADGAGGRRGRGFARFDQLVTAAQLRALLAVAESGNFSLAARAVGISQPSLHRLARDLERLSGNELFVRTRLGIRLSPPAERLSRFARLALAELQQGLDEVASARGIDSASVQIGTLPLARTSILPGAINRLARERPDVRIRVVDGLYDDLLRDLRQGEIDVIVGALREPAPIDDIVQTKLFDDTLAIVARSQHPLAARKRITMRDLGQYSWIAPRTPTPTRRHFEALFAEADIAVPPGLIEASSLMLIRGLLLDSDRLTLVSAHQVEPEIRHGMLCILAYDLTHTSRPIGITVRRDWRPTATQARLLDLLREVCETDISLQQRYSATE
ncbi:MAG: LysR family transcriptional regulator [Hyphomicrobiaceae bacterium]